MIILDTNVISELMKPMPSQRVSGWVAAQPLRSLFTTALNQAEILYGLELLPKGRRRDLLVRSVDEMFTEDFADRILPFDYVAAHQCALIAIHRRKVGKPISQVHAQIAATARSHGAAIATRNIADFEDCGLALITPWS